MQFRTILFAGSILFSLELAAQELTVSPDQAGGVYKVGQTVHWQVDWKAKTPAPVAQFRFLNGGLTEVGHGNLVFSNGVAGLETRFTEPGTMLVEVRLTNGTNPIRVAGGAVASPGKIGLALPKPEDFDAFWQAELKELAAIPAHPMIESVNIADTNVSYWKITMDNIRGTHINGQLARPAQGKKFPALLILQYAGVYGLKKSWVTDRAKEGWLALNIEAHDLPIDQTESFYQTQNAGPLREYQAIGNADRETSYFLRMYLSAHRALEYLTEREDWDGKTLVVMGDSQGGMQSLMLAGLHPKQITAVTAMLPAGCDLTGPAVGRAGGWPNWYFSTNGQDPQKVREASRYYDVVNFAPQIRCPVLVGAGLRDETCPPAGIFAALNQITAPKEIVILPDAGHFGSNNQFPDALNPFNARRWKVWMPALVRGEPAPLMR